MKKFLMLTIIVPAVLFATITLIALIKSDFKISVTGNYIVFILKSIKLFSLQLLDIFENIIAAITLICCLFFRKKVTKLPPKLPPYLQRFKEWNEQQEEKYNLPEEDRVKW